MIAEGEIAPDFEGATADGRRLRLSSLRGRPVVLYFYPKAGTMGCTRESKEFAARYPELQAHDAEVVGISVDDTVAQAKFTEDCRLPFPLIADRDGAISRLYGVLGAFGRARRVTFLLDAEGRVSRVIDAFLPGPHARGVASALTAR